MSANLRELALIRRKFAKTSCPPKVPVGGRVLEWMSGLFSDNEKAIETRVTKPERVEGSDEITAKSRKWQGRKVQGTAAIQSPRHDRGEARKLCAWPR